MCETFVGKVFKLNYETVRYPGHFNLMRFFFKELFMRHDSKRVGAILVHAKPQINEDVAFVYAALEGWRKEALFRGGDLSAVIIR